MQNVVRLCAVLCSLFVFGCGDNWHLDDCDGEGHADWDGDVDEWCDNPHCRRDGDPPTSECVLSDECPDEGRCVDGSCEAPPVVGEPVPDPEEHAMCMGDGECAGGRCDDGMCHLPCEEGEECGTGQVCLSGICEEERVPAGECATSMDCASGGTCVDTRCYSACTAHSDCANPADFCDHGLCRPDWRPTTSCVTRSDCGSDHCVDGQCRAACWADDECAAGACDRGFCAPAT